MSYGVMYPSNANAVRSTDMTQRRSFASPGDPRSRLAVLPQLDLGITSWRNQVRNVVIRFAQNASCAVNRRRLALQVNALRRIAYELRHEILDAFFAHVRMP